MYFFLLQESLIHRALFWVSISVLQLDDMALYAAGLSLLEQNLHTLDSQGIFENNVNLSLFSFLLIRLWKKIINHLIYFIVLHF